MTVEELRASSPGSGQVCPLWEDMLVPGAILCTVTLAAWRVNTSRPTTET